MVRNVRAAGAVLWRFRGAGDTPGASAVEVAIVHRPRYDDWSLPKGKLERGETRHAAAVREVAEETGFAAVLGRHLGRVGYPVPEGDKTVDYYAARAAGGEFAPNEEVDELRWLPAAAAADLLSYPHDRVVLSRFTEFPPDTVTVLLVRHGHAGRKKLWTGPDDQRPLSPTGRHQADALTALLPLFGADRVFSVPKERCVATVAPLAGLLGVPVVPEPALAEAPRPPDSPRGPTDPAPAVARLRDIARAGGTPVVCSQGGVIPGVVGALLADLPGGSGVEPDELKSPKGSAWVLSFTPDGRLVSADHIPHPAQADRA
ncbi:NUDIX hydrolase [Actinokineospora auranticolor]|uniref:8-oxo-dGTP diphosphatase n=1 Tax=Actinokineospora auranticolor TaxID=155976 RepID=A0A2S6GGQ3_9PSEU|nr:NUDIX hydrolase [Actinokineospora auranticolor]PPK64326.1 8-oxo-dGTP diphosphatase [Actinokineospora auranticolor]